MGNSPSYNFCCQNRATGDDSNGNIEYVILSARRGERDKSVTLLGAPEDYDTTNPPGELEERDMQDTPFQRKFKNRKLPQNL